MPILLNVKNGQFGFNLQITLTPPAEITAVGQSEYELSGQQGILRLVATVRPNTIVNPAGHTVGDKVESEHGLVLAIKSAATKKLGAKPHRVNALVVHSCNEHVYDRISISFHREGDILNPCSVKGARNIVVNPTPEPTIDADMVFHVSWVFNSHGANLAKTALRSMIEQDGLNVVADQFGRAISAALAADVTDQVLGQCQCDDVERLHHIAATSVATWYRSATTVIAVAQWDGTPLKLTPESIRLITTAKYPQLMIRPAKSRLATNTQRRTVGLPLPSDRRASNTFSGKFSDNCDHA